MFAFEPLNLLTIQLLYKSYLILYPQPMDGRKQVRFKTNEKEVTVFILIPLPLSKNNVASNIAAFTTTTKSLRKLRAVLKFINSFKRKSKTKEILRVIEDFLLFPNNAKDTLIFTENYLFVRSSLYQEVLTRRQVEQINRELQPALEELFANEI